MELHRLRVKNFKSIDDSGEFAIGSITCLVGKNESGKTALLQAISKLKPVVSSHGLFDEVMEFPRNTYSDFTDEDRPKEVLWTQWELQDSDIEAIEDLVGPGAITNRTIILEKGYDNTLKWTVDIAHQVIVRTFIDDAGLYAEETAELESINTVSDLIKALKGVPSPSERQTSLLTELTKVFPQGAATSAVHKLLEELLPTFLYFGNYEAMKGEVSLQQIATSKANGELSMPDRIFEALLEMAGTKVEEIQEIKRFEPLIAKLEAVSNRLTREIFRYWSQNKHLAIEFRFDAARPEDKPPLNTGYIFRTRIKNTRHGATISFDERSTGFVWFFSFLVWFSQVKERFSGSIILLLDEPGLNLHAKAQNDLLRYIKEKLEPQHEVVYSTHSPFMIDPERLLSVRTVEDVIKNDEVLGTKVREDVLATERDTLFPLQAALGYEIAQTLFVGQYIILVEGPSDLLYFQWASEQLRRRKQTTLDSRWVITPAGSIDKIASFASLFGGKGVHLAAVTDLGHGDRNKVQRLREHELLRAGHVLTVETYTSKSEADVEDLLGRSAYIALVNETYNLAKSHRLPAKPPSGAPVRVAKEVEAHFATLPPTIDQYNHFAPAAYLVEHSPTLVTSLPELDAALGRFEALFKDLNSLLS